MKTVLLGLALSGLTVFRTLGCPVCERNQPKLLRGIVHGSGPDGNIDYIIVGFIMLISLFALFLMIKWIAMPGEKQTDHIKRFIINTNDHE